MGIKDLWGLITPYCEKKPLFELKGKIVAIDLSGWVCESLNVVDYFVHPRFYLRNLFFRTCYLLQIGIVPVFVLEGSAPPLKYGVIIKRNQLQFRGARPKKVVDCDKQAKQQPKIDGTQRPPEQKRNRFHHVLKQCEELLSSMGITCVQAPGEAEALCAYLNRDGLVDGVISQDSDCFAYGAIRVYRNFCAAQNGGSVDIYDMEKIRKVLDIGQEKIVAMGILSGCDYCPAGVQSVGKETIIRLLSCYTNNEILGKIRSWRATMNRLTDLEIKVEDKSVCSDCGHRGKVTVHRRVGCPDCQTKNGCDESRWKNLRMNIKAEMDIKRKALQDPAFPSEAIVDEFMVRSCDLPELDLSWRQPNIVKFVRSMAPLLQWNEIYCFQKMLPLFTRWQTLKLSKSPSQSGNIALEPKYIKKKRSPKGVASFEIVWSDNAGIFSGLIPDDQIQQTLDEAGNSLDALWSTIEPQDIVELAYPELVQLFVSSKAKPKKATQGKSNTKSKSTKQRRLEEFLSSLSANNMHENLASQEHDSEEQGPSKEINGCNTSIGSVDLERIVLDSLDDSGTMDLSGIIDRVCDPSYGKASPVETKQILTSMSVDLDEATEEVGDENTQDVERMLLLKQDIIEGISETANQSLLNSSIRLRKRKSFFFEPIDVSSIDLQDHNNEMDMFECSLMVKDQVVVCAADQMNRTIIYDVDF